MAEQYALDHAWAWFSVHAAQRLQLVGFLLLSVSVLSAAYASAFDHHPGVSGAVGLTGMAVTTAFRRLELRTRELVHVGEAPLVELEARLANLTKIDSLSMVTAAESPQRRITKYSHLIRFVHWVALAAFGAGSVFAFWN